MVKSLSLQAVENGKFRKLIKDGIRNAVASLSHRFDCELSVELTEVKQVSLDAGADVLERPEEMVSAVCLTVSSEIDEHIVIACEAEFVYSMLQMLRGRCLGKMEPLTDHDRLNLGEVCSVIGAAFVSTLGNDRETSLHSGPPVIVFDKAGVILDFALAKILGERICIYIVKSKLFSNDLTAPGRFLIMISDINSRQPTGLLEALN